MGKRYKYIIYLEYKYIIHCILGEYLREKRKEDKKNITSKELVRKLCSYINLMYTSSTRSFTPNPEYL